MINSRYHIKFLARNTPARDLYFEDHVLLLDRRKVLRGLLQEDKMKAKQAVHTAANKKCGGTASL